MLQLKTVNWCQVLYLFGLLILNQGITVTSFAARFIRQPSNETVVAGTRQIRIQCHIQDYEGAVTWVKDGFAVFSNAGSAFTTRYSIEQTKSNNGVQNLLIKNVTIADDAFYECQDLFLKIRSRKAYINVLVPPRRLVISSTDEQNRLTVRENEPVTIYCKAEASKPGTGITWEVGMNQVFRPVINETIPGSKLITSSSAMSMTPTRSHNGATVKCLATHPALDQVISTTATINVLYPPGNPTFGDFEKEQLLVAGTNLSLKCVSRGGNPLASITWKVGGRTVPGELRTLGDRAISVIRYRLQPDDDGKKVTCIVNSPALSAPLFAGTKINVHYPPAEVLVSQHPLGGVFENSSTSLTCRTTQSNPKASLTWYRDGEPIARDSGDIIVTQFDLTSHSQSTLMMTRVNRYDAKSIYSCRSSISELGYQKDTETRISVNYAPLYVNLRMYDIVEKDNQPGLQAGQTIQMKCSAKGGNPAPSLTWYRNSRVISSDDETVTRIDPSQVLDCNSESFTCSAIEIVLTASDNGRKFECHADHVASNVAKRDSVVLEVMYAPKTVKISQFPQTLISGERMSLVCETSPSFPASDITWHIDGELIEFDTGNTESDVDFSVVNSNRPSIKENGFISRSQLYFTPSFMHDGSRVTCRASNDKVGKYTDGSVTLNVMYAPIISTKALAFNTTQHNREFVINIPIRANPSNVTFRWWKYTRLPQASKSRVNNVLINDISPLWGPKVALQSGERIRRLSDSGVLRIHNVRNDDGGLYQVEVSNSRGSAAANFTIDVLYSPKIRALTGPTEVKEGSDAILTCEFKGHPLLKTEVHWIKVVSNPRRERYDIKSSKNSSMLTLRNVTSFDRGQYRCVTSNGIGSAAERLVFLNVKFGAVIDQRRSTAKVARPPPSGERYSAELVCTANGNPQVAFTWQDADGSDIISGVSDILETGYVIDEESYVNDVYTSKLFVNTRVVHSDDSLVAKFRCIATNSLGQDETEVKLVPRGPPDAPSEVTVTNITHDAISLSWQAGFDGGAPQTFLLQYKMILDSLITCDFDEISSDWSQINVPNSRTNYVIEGLQQSTSYGVCMLAFNRFGRSSGTKIRVVSTNSVQASSSNAGFENQLPTNYLLIIAASSALILVILIILVVVIGRRLRQRNVHKSQSVRTEIDTLPTPNASLTSSENAESLRIAQQTSSFVNNSSLECDTTSDHHRFKDSRHSLERNSMSRVAYSTDGMSGRQSDLSNYEGRHLPHHQRLSRDTSVSSLLHDEIAYTNEMYQRCGAVPTSKYNDARQLSPPGTMSIAEERDRFLDQCSADTLLCDSMRQSPQICQHAMSWDTCVRCVKDRSRAPVMSGRYCDIIRHAEEPKYPPVHRYHTLSLNPKRPDLPAHQFPAIHNNIAMHNSTDNSQQQIQFLDKNNCQTLPPMLRSYSSSSFLNSKRRYVFDDRCYQLQPLLSPDLNSEPKYETTRDSFYAVNVHDAQTRLSPDLPNESGLYVLDVGLSTDKNMGEARVGMEAGMECTPPCPNDIPCVRNSWISSSSSTSDYGSQKSGIREKQSAESKPTSRPQATSPDSTELSNGSTRPLPTRVVTCNDCDTTSKQGHIASGVLPPVSFQDIPKENIAPIDSEVQSPQMVFLGVDSDGTLFV
uniref:Nephrin n=1 Tax=Phallusia mammillata TaxID=59560 RepID=A0A6F9DNE1_9ASCI|nr:nephrin [Phallusia mammillata]